MSPPPPSPAPRIVIIGIGNPDRGDDGVGQVVTQRLRQELDTCPHVRVVQHSGDGTQLLSVWQDADLAIVVDAVQSGAPPGTVHRLEAHQPPLPAASWRCSTHAFGVAEALALARVLQQLPPTLLLYGIEGHTFAPGAGLSAAGARSVPVVVARIRQDIDDFQAAGCPCCRSFPLGAPGSSPTPDATRERGLALGAEAPPRHRACRVPRVWHAAGVRSARRGEGIAPTSAATDKRDDHNTNIQRQED